MKFAVVEYTSKSGKIWHHTPSRPNYLCDPQTEIDPTSFGCYVSALAGEHIPLTALIKPTFFKKILKRLRGSWPQQYSLEYLRDFEVLLIVHQMSDGHEVTAFTRRLKSSYPHLFIMGVPTQPFELLRRYGNAHAEWLADFRDFMGLCDVFVSIVRQTVPYWQGLSRAPVAYIPQPYPAHFATKYFFSRAKKQKSIYVAGVTSRPLITRGYQVAAALQKKFPEYAICVTALPGSDVDARALAGSRVSIRPFEKWQEHLASQREVMLVINTDYTFTRGRVQMDCAAVGTPSLGSNSDAQRDLYPELYATPETPTTQLVELGSKLLRDEDYYTQVVQHAQTRLPFYDYEQSAERINALVKKYNTPL